MMFCQPSYGFKKSAESPGRRKVALVLRPKLRREALAVAADPEAARDKFTRVSRKL